MWRSLDLHLLADDDSAPALAELLPELRDRRQTMARIVATGRAGLAARTALATMVAEAAPDFGWLVLDDSGLATDCAVEDLDQIDRAGALREAADALLAESEDDTRSAAERAIAAAALTRLYGFAKEMA